MEGNFVKIMLTGKSCINSTMQDETQKCFYHIPIAYHYGVGPKSSREGFRQWSHNSDMKSEHHVDVSEHEEPIFYVSDTILRILELLREFSL